MEGEINSQLERVLVIILVVIFGSGSWLSMSGVWSEIPVLVVLGLPEKSRITSYITILVQVGCVGVIAFLICNKFLASTRVYRPEIPATYVVTFIGTIGTFLMIFFWDSPTYFSGDPQPHSVAFLTIAFLIAMVDVTTNTLSMGYISLLKPDYLNWLWVGQGMSNILPACVVLIQHTGGSKGTCVANFTFMNETVVGNSTLKYSCTSWSEVAPTFLFAPEQYFGFLFAMMLSCHISFICLNTLPCARREYAPQRDGHHLKRDGCGGLFQSRDTTSSGEMHELLNVVPETIPDGNVVSSGPNNVVDGNFMEGELMNWQVVFLYIMSFLNLGILFGILAPIQGYSGSAYGSSTYELVMPLREITGALAFLLFLFKPVYSFKVVALSFLLGFISSLYCIMAATLSPHPPFSNLLVGKVLIVVAWMSAGLFHCYSRAAIAWILRHTPDNRKHLIWSGVLGQLGVIIGAITMFILINVCNVFEAYTDQELCPIHPTCTEHLKPTF